MEWPRGNRDDRPFPCSKCPASFKTRSKLHRHKYTHTGKKPFKCPVSGCSRLFIEKYELRNHSDRYHSGIIREKLVKCDLCECAFYTKSSLATHLATRHSYCASCDVDLKDFSALTAHQRAHEQGSSFTCHLCSIGILDGLQFKNHWLTHVDAPRHIQCSKCSKKFKSEKNLQSHFSYTHALLEVRAQCKLCPKSFPNLRQLRHHETGHVRQHACYFCKKNFGNISSLRDHMTTHTREVAYFCDVEQCGFSTSTYSGLSSHVNNMHTVGFTRTYWSCYFCSVKVSEHSKI